MRVDLIETKPTDVKVGDEVPPSLNPGLNLKCHTLKLCPNSTTVLIGRNGRGQWIARERHGLYGGLFVSREKAVRYALFENGHRMDAIIDVAGILELDMSIVPMPDLPARQAA